MQNRRNRSYHSYQSGSNQMSKRAEPSFKLQKKTLIYAVLVFIVGVYLVNRGGASAETQPVIEHPKAASLKEPPKQEQPAFPTLNTNKFTATQQRMLGAMKEEYSKHPISYDETVMQYTEGKKESWCADFISVVRFESGKPFVNQDTGYWRIPGVQSLRDYYARSSAYHLVGDYVPKFGDVAFYFGETPDGGSREHVAFVLEVRGDKIVTLGGNETDKGILQVRYDSLKEGTKGLTGFGESKL